MNVLEEGGEFVTGLFPPIAVTTAGRRDPRALHGRLPDRGRHLHRRRGPDHLVGHPLPAQARRRHAAAPDPRQQHRRVRLDGRPDDHRHLHVRHLVADAQQRRSTARPTRRRRSGPSPASSSGSSTTSTRTGRPSSTRSCCRWSSQGGGMVVPAGRTVQLQLFVSPERRHPRVLRARSSCSSATSSRAGRTSFDFTVNESDAGQTFRGQCAELCGTGHSHHAVRGQGADRRASSTRGWPTRSPRPTRRRRRPRAAGRARRCRSRRRH